MSTRRAFLSGVGAAALPFSPLGLGLGHALAAPAKLDLLRFERRRILAPAPALLKEAPVTVTASSSPRSAGGKNDYFSEADYWWPDPKNPNGPYIQRDGQTNPENFDDHRKAMRRLSVQMPALTAAWLASGKRAYADHAVKHLSAWFVDPATAMTPHLLYSQAIRNKVTGRSIGVIDTIHLVEVARAAAVLEETGAIDKATSDAVKAWFTKYLTWITTHEYGTKERDADNNHGTCWVMQAAEFARYTGNAEVTKFCVDRYKTVLLKQMAADGSFPREIGRTKPYGYSLFNLDIMAAVCQILSTPADNLWTYELKDDKGSRGMKHALAYLFPYVADKKKWPKPPDVMYWKEWPMRHPFLLFGGQALEQPEYIALWKKLPADSKVDEVIRNFPVRQPVLWYPVAAVKKA